MIAGNENRSWPVIQSTAVLVTRRVPLSVWAICDANVCVSWLQTGEVVAVRARTITAICFLRFIFSPLVDSIFPFVVLALFGSSLLSCHFWPFTGVLRKIFGSLTREVREFLEQPAFAKARA